MLAAVVNVIFAMQRLYLYLYIYMTFYDTFLGLNVDGYLVRNGSSDPGILGLKGFTVSHALGEDNFEERRVQQFLVFRPAW